MRRADVANRQQFLLTGILAGNCYAHPFDDGFRFLHVTDSQGQQSKVGSFLHWPFES